MEFHIARSIREKTGLDDVFFSYTGNVVFADAAASRKLAQRLNEARGDALTEKNRIHAGALFAMGLIDELSHALAAQYRRRVDPAVLAESMHWFAARAGAAPMEKMLLAFTEQFPCTAVYRGDLTAAEWLNAATEGMPNREAAMEEMMLLWLANINPAFKPFRELYDDTGLKKRTVYAGVTTGLPQYFQTRPPFKPAAGSLLDALMAPMLASPDSISGQLEYIREHWAEYLGDDLKRVLLAIDVLREEEIAIWMLFHPTPRDKHGHGEHGRGNLGFDGDEYTAFDKELALRRKRYAHDYQAPLHEYEAFSADQAWMPNVVLMAKSTYVWLEQLSQKYLRHIHRLDQIPPEELQLLAARGVTGLWLIGLWERSTASRTIKRLCGQHDAVASAYSLKTYEIAADLGGDEGYRKLQEQAAAVGIRLASDMVPNHMGIDSDWVIEHPDWFLYRWESPFPAYRFEGPNLSSDARVEIKIEDHYYDRTDAAVVFRLRHHREFTTRYLYHGNDGTSFAWNDTAQLDYSRAEVREHVIQMILHVARLFPIIRFDAAMVLAKRHVQRLWFPLPGAGGSIPSRAENAISQEEFDALMPAEFWREVVDRVAAEVPGTLLLAEAFWLLEGYFVRTLGMHRVYNSAFMIMLRDEENAKYRSYLKKTIEFDPDILKRYVNFMSNPDERTAIDQFGSGDKYFGVCTLLATLPGLPMFAHGQIEGYTERYGMEFKQAKMQEHADEGMVARHMREIAPLLESRPLFAESTHFVLYDFYNEYGAVDENVFAYSNRLGDRRAVIVYNNSYGGRSGTIRISAAAMDKRSGRLQQLRLSEGLALSEAENVVIAYRDRSTGLEHLVRATDLYHHGMRFDLRGYQYAVLMDWRELHSSWDHPWDQLCDTLNGAGVHSVDREFANFKLRPVHAALRAVIRLENVPASPSLARKNARKGKAAAVATPPHDFAASLERFYARASEVMPQQCGRAASLSSAAQDPEPDSVLYHQASEIVVKDTASLLQQIRGAKPAVGRLGVLGEWPWLSWSVLKVLPWEAPALDLYECLHLRAALAESFLHGGLEHQNAWRAAALVRVLLAYPGALNAASRGDGSFWSDGNVRWLAGVHDAAGTTYVVKEEFESLLGWLAVPALSADDAAAKQAAALISSATKAMTKSGYRLLDFQTASPTTPKRRPARPKPALEPVTAKKPFAKSATKTKPKAASPAAKPTSKSAARPKPKKKLAAPRKIKPAIKPAPAKKKSPATKASAVKAVTPKKVKAKAVKTKKKK